MKIVPAMLSAVLFVTAPAWAVLGEYEASVNSDQQSLRGELRTIPREGYSIQQITSRDGTVVKEYVSPQGLVFGISWRGPAMPNLQELLGAYFAQWQQAQRSQAHRRGPLVLRTDKLVVESGGHLRAFHGRAYVPNLMPNNIRAEVVQ